MSHLEWKPEYSVNVNAFDDQHKKLVGMLNSLNQAMTEGRGKQVLESVLSEMIVYAEEHFKNEEKMFTQYQYPDAVNHIVQHDEFRKKITEIKGKFDSGNYLVTVDLLNFLYAWIENHIQKVDKKYSEFFNSKGIH